VATHCTVYFNGTAVHHNWSGYASFQIDVTPMARYGDDAINTISVRVDAEDTEGWWYEGGGIYRHTWLVKRSPVHIGAAASRRARVGEQHRRQDDGTGGERAVEGGAQPRAAGVEDRVHEVSPCRPG
jgi:beta-galactosidase/beta-glucuronidase